MLTGVGWWDTILLKWCGVGKSGESEDGSKLTSIRIIGSPNHSSSLARQVLRVTLYVLVDRSG